MPTWQFFHPCLEIMMVLLSFNTDLKLPQKYSTKSEKRFSWRKWGALQLTLKSVNSQEVNYKNKFLKKYTQTLTCSPETTAPRVSFQSQAGYTEVTAGRGGRPLRYLYPMITLSRMLFPSFEDTVKGTEVHLLVRLPGWWANEHIFPKCSSDFS